MSREISPTSPLTPRETTCLNKAAEGKTNRQIAKELHLAENTVKTHFKNIHQKLCANNKVHAVALAMKKHYIQPLFSLVIKK